MPRFRWQYKRGNYITLAELQAGCAFYSGLIERVLGAQEATRR